MDSLESRPAGTESPSIVGRELPAWVRQDIEGFIEACGRRPRYSTGIHGYLTRGYGRLDEFGFWRYPLPDGEFVGC